jgi:pyruvate formate lyase activating enzyme
MKFKGFHKVSLIDYPGKICAIGFTGGCNFRCHYCHNPELVIGYNKLPDIKEEEILSFIKKRKGLIDGLCISGGEPTMHKELPEFMEKIKKLGALVKLDTNGTNSSMIREIIEKGLVDYIAMDIKGPISRYREIVGVKVDTSEIEESVKIIMKMASDYEFRTTVFPEFFTQKDAKEIAEWLKGAKRYVIQKPQTEKTLDGKFKPSKLYSDEELRNFCKILPNCIAIG